MSAMDPHNGPMGLRPGCDILDQSRVAIVKAINLVNLDQSCLGDRQTPKAYPHPFGNAAFSGCIHSSQTKSHETRGFDFGEWWDSCAKVGQDIANGED